MHGNDSKHLAEMKRAPPPPKNRDGDIPSETRFPPRCFGAPAELDQQIQIRIPLHESADKTRFAPIRVFHLCGCNANFTQVSESKRTCDGKESKQGLRCLRPQHKKEPSAPRFVCTLSQYNCAREDVTGESGHRPPPSPPHPQTCAVRVAAIGKGRKEISCFSCQKNTIPPLLPKQCCCVHKYDSHYFTT